MGPRDLRNWRRMMIIISPRCFINGHERNVKNGELQQVQE